MSMPELFETHCHLNHRDFASDLPEALLRARRAGVREHLVIGWDLESSRRAVELADPGQGLFAAVGIHPHHASEWSAEVRDELVELAGSPGVIAYGEIGLDFYRNLSPREAQFRAFEEQLTLARERLNLPLIIHTRESMADTLDVLSGAPLGAGGVLHCWSGSCQEAERAVDLGWHLGIGGVVTYKNPGSLPDVARATSLDRILLETDCPYLTPTPYRGKRNEPSYLALVLGRLAMVLDRSESDLAAQTRANAARLFNTGLAPANKISTSV